MLPISRRQWLSLAASASVSTLPAIAGKSAARSRVIGANDRIQVGMIGVGGKGSSHLRALLGMDGIQVVGISDVYTRRRENSRKSAKLEEKAIHPDYRDLIARPDVDCVFIATPDHWHARMAIDAMAAGKDVYLEKPMTLTIGEAHQVLEAARKYERVLQVGSQHLSDARYHKAKELIEAGAIGELLWAQTSYSRNSVHGEWNYFIDPEGTPENIDWTRWLGSAPKRPFSAERYFRWRKYWDYSGGIATDLFYHRLGPILFAMGAQLPVRVTASGGIYVQKDREVPDTYATVIEYPNFYINISSSMANSASNKQFSETIYGHKGTISFSGNQVVMTPESVAGKEAQTQTFDIESTDISLKHRENFFAAMRSRKQTILNPELGYQIMVAIKLGVDSYREGRAKGFDPRTQKATEKFAPRPGYEGKGENFEGGRRRG